jgi:two-component system chemotaxis response regulator CheB
MAEDGDIAIKRIIEIKPDVITLDLVMPRMDGFTVLRWAMENHPVPIVVCSSFNDRDRVFKALELGAVDFLLKSLPRSSQDPSRIEHEIVRRVESAAAAKMRFDGITVDAKAASLAAEQLARGKEIEIICVAASTGGPAAIQKLISSFNEEMTIPMIVVQHMPPGFTGSFARHLNGISHYFAREARNLDTIKAGGIYIAPAGHVTRIRRMGGNLMLEVTERDQTKAIAPSADELFASAAESCGEHILGLVLTGMGEDGAEGAESVIGAGGHILAESDESAVVFGMPRAVIERGCATAVLPLSEMPNILLAYTLTE